MEQTAVGIIGATGYTALELIRILLRHPCAEITTLTTRRDPQPVSRIHPSLIGRLDLHTQTLDPEDVAQQCDVVFCCLPHVASMETVPRLLDAGARVIDLCMACLSFMPSEFPRVILWRIPVVTPARRFWGWHHYWLREWSILQGSSLMPRVV